MSKILFVSHDPGGISSLGPVIPAVQAFAETELWLHPFSATVYKGSCRAITSFADEDVLAALRVSNPDLIVTGTSMEPDSIDKKVIAAAWKLGIPSITFVDFWANYAERFTHMDGSQILPDMVVTIDDTARLEMIEAGVPDSLIEIVGFTRLPPKPAPAATDGTHFTLLFISQALSQIYGGEDASRKRIGYTQKDAFDLLAREIETFGASIGKKVELWLRHHPKEDCWIPDIPHTVVNSLPLEACLAQANLVTGMTGSMLIDALFMGRPVVSFQPNMIGHDRLMPSRQGHVIRVNSPDETLPALIKAAGQSPSLPETLGKAADGKGVERFCKHIKSMLKQTFHQKTA